MPSASIRTKYSRAQPRGRAGGEDGDQTESLKMDSSLLGRPRGVLDDDQSVERDCGAVSATMLGSIDGDVQTEGNAPKKKRKRTDRSPVPQTIEESDVSIVSYDEKGLSQAQMEWVNCDLCGKWRELPPHVTAMNLPDTWHCELNTWDKKVASCDADESGVYEDKSSGEELVDVKGKKCISSYIFDNYVVPEMVKAGWICKNISRRCAKSKVSNTDILYVPPGVVPKAPLKKRIDFFDSRKQLFRYLRSAKCKSNKLAQRVISYMDSLDELIHEDKKDYLPSRNSENRIWPILAKQGRFSLSDIQINAISDSDASIEDNSHNGNDIDNNEEHEATILNGTDASDRAAPHSGNEQEKKSALYNKEDVDLIVSRTRNHGSESPNENQVLCADSPGKEIGSLVSELCFAVAPTLTPTAVEKASLISVPSSTLQGVTNVNICPHLDGSRNPESKGVSLLEMHETKSASDNKDNTNLIVSGKRNHGIELSNENQIQYGDLLGKEIGTLFPSSQWECNNAGSITGMCTSTASKTLQTSELCHALASTLTSIAVEKASPMPVPSPLDGELIVSRTRNHGSESPNENQVLCADSPGKEIGSLVSELCFAVAPTLTPTAVEKASLISVPSSTLQGVTNVNICPHLDGSRNPESKGVSLLEMHETKSASDNKDNTNLIVSGKRNHGIELSNENQIQYGDLLGKEIGTLFPSSQWECNNAGSITGMCASTASKTLQTSELCHALASTLTSIAVEKASPMPVPSSLSTTEMTNANIYPYCDGGRKPEFKSVSSLPVLYKEMDDHAHKWGNSQLELKGAESAFEEANRRLIKARKKENMCRERYKDAHHRILITDPLVHGVQGGQY